MLTVTQLARSCGMTSDAVRYYCKKGLIVAERHPYNGYRLFSEENIHWLIFIQKAKRLGFTLSEIRKIREDADKGCSPCPRVREMLSNRIQENKARIDELQVLQNRMELAFVMWSKMSDEEPEGRTVCRLIESYSEIE